MDSAATKPAAASKGHGNTKAANSLGTEATFGSAQEAKYHCQAQGQGQRKALRAALSQPRGQHECGQGAKAGSQAQQACDLDPEAHRHQLQPETDNYRRRQA